MNKISKFPVLLKTGLGDSWLSYQNVVPWRKYTRTRKRLSKLTILFGIATKNPLLADTPGLGSARSHEGPGGNQVGDRLHPRQADPSPDRSVQEPRKLRLHQDSAGPDELGRRRTIRHRLGSGDRGSQVPRPHVLGETGQGVRSRWAPIDRDDNVEPEPSCGQPDDRRL